MEELLEKFLNKLENSSDVLLAIVAYFFLKIHQQHKLIAEYRKLIADELKEVKALLEKFLKKTSGEKDE